MHVGIDLGTSYSLISRLEEDGRPALVPDSRDSELVHTPSVVHVSEGSAFVGPVVEDLLEQDPDIPVIRFFKRRLGAREPIYYDDRGESWHAEGIGALILQKLRFDAESRTAADVQGAVITVPAHFNDVQRKAVVGASMLADLPLLGLVEEPVAAALHYGVVREARDRVLLVYDFGGGTFDATTLSLDENGVYVLAKTGLTDLGGKELDDRVAALMLEQFANALGRDLDLDARALHELRRAAEDIKIELCGPEVDRVCRTVVLAGEVVEIDIRRREFERHIEEYLERTVETTVRCLKESGLAIDDVSTVLLVGGSSLVPAVVDRLGSHFGTDRLCYHEPSRAVAYGAAMHAAQVAGEAERYRLPPELRGVTGHHLGVRTVDPATSRVEVDVLVRKNMPLPVRARKVYYTTGPEQSEVVLDLVQYQEGPEDSVPLGRLVIGPLAAPRANYPIELEVDYRVDGTVGVHARDAESGIELRHTFGGDPSGDVAYLSAQRALLAQTRLGIG